ncbi:unnamed protein product [Parnassius apollo]|uniref:(apollo) hypothetical protein n=1 Tax=Parnassius apollo TaxID=110799 RepID=A0A8S3XEJ3_PARAO|nr:unnamed protein product [Parnassius apollo]
MKNSDKKFNECDSPKTPGGISKSLLTPIRRLGLSRKWKKPGSSPFVSPLASNTIKPSDEDGEEKKSRKRKLCVDEEPENIQLTPVVDNTVENVNSEVISTPPLGQDSTVNTPIRKVKRKKSKTLLSSSSCAQSRETTKNPSYIHIQDPGNLNVCTEVRQTENTAQEEQQTSNSENLENKSPTQVVLEREVNIQSERTEIPNEKKKGNLEPICEESTSENVVIAQTKVPNNLTKECIVVIQNKIFKPANKNRTKNDICKRKNNSMSQVIFDSDSDDVPLSCMNKKEDLQKESLNDDFSNIKSTKEPKVQQSMNKSSLKDRKIATSEKKKTHKITKHSKDENLPEKKIEQIALNSSSQSSNSFEDDDDDDFEMNKRTILVRKSYDKVTKISKAKSTGSITQRDIDELKARIETKKKLLFAKAMTKETEELRGLIKKWQKGCQDALMELLELMKKKLPDQSNMDYSNILDMLKIPHDLVGYDPENDCFVTPDDNSILALTFNDL